MNRIFERYNYLGARSYYCHHGDSSKCWQNIKDVITESNLIKRRIEPVAVLSVLMNNYILANRTMVENIYRTPWMAKPDGNGAWEYAEIPQHGYLKRPTEIIAIKFKKLLYNEALEFLQGKETIGILLSGGMDSRVVAGIISETQKNGDYNGHVVALTWGCDDARDLIYARLIAKRFRWEHIHLPLTAEVLLNNIKLTALRGAEYSPVHLHAMEAVSQVKGLDGILAGSFGDNIGRGEYHGVPVANISFIGNRNHNKFKFLLKSIEAELFRKRKDDIYCSRNLYPRNSEIASREVDLQMHYWHRQLSPCMSIIDDKIPLYQMFGKPDVFGFMWSLDFSCRNNDTYEFLLKMLPGDLLGIPWARTGCIYNSKQKKPLDSYSSLNNRYGKWLRNDCRSYITEKIGDGMLQSLGIFDEKALAVWMKLWPRSTKARANRLDEQIAWLASLACFVRNYDIKGVPDPIVISPADTFFRIKGIIYNMFYQKALEVLKNE